LNLMRRLPPLTIKKNLAALIRLFPDLSNELLEKVDLPLGKEQRKKFIFKRWRKTQK